MGKGKKMAAAALAAFSLAAFAPGFGAAPCHAAQVIEHWGRPEDPYGLYLGRGLPLMVRSQYLPAEVVGGRAHWSGLWFFEPPGEMERMAQALEAYSAEERDEALAGNRQLAVKTLLVHRADTQVVSFVESTAAYRGGIRGRYVLVGRNYDVAEGRELAFSDVFSLDDPNELAALIAEKLRADYPDAPFAKDGAALSERLEKAISEETISWTLEQRGAAFYFNSRSLGRRPPQDAVDTIYTATVFYDEQPEFFAPAFRRGQESWCLELDWDVPLWVEFGDGQKSRVEVRRDAEGFHIALDGARFTDPEPLRGMFRPVLLSVRDGRRFLYVDELDVDGDAAKLRIYDLNGGAIRRVPWESSLTMLASDAADTNLREWIVMTNPSSFVLYDPKGKEGPAFCACRLNPDGTPDVTRVMPPVERGEDGAPMIWP